MQSLSTLPATDGRDSLTHPPAAWQQSLRDAVTDPEQLLRLLALPQSLLPAARLASARFGLRVPRSYLSRIRPGDPHDPLLRQILPLDAELREVSGYSKDAVGDLATARPGGLLHKYQGRALLIVTGACAIHCRYCFRRHFPYASHHAGGSALDQAIDGIAQDESLQEIILSGGDPLSLSTPRLRQITDRLARISHVHTLRIHSRTPVVLPERVDQPLLDWLQGLRQRLVFVTHVNHPNEIDRPTGQTLRHLGATGACMLNQSVLLKAVNDDADTLVLLMQTLFKHGVLPYYLHLPDKVAGTAHFDVRERRARQLLRQLAARVPGYLVPKLVKEESGAGSKTIIGF